ncbi:ImmA/IrrE family metallo-endopeptidase [Desulfoscipio sp. XC116]|uniref:ImmA/IrrE family metallo-endopeptidase n=1 Tax=Desulfoscipio sp. XC116 TaxID=3144975 RepID=UPI00325A776F
MQPPIALDKLQINRIKRLAEIKRRTLGFVGDTPIASQIFTILENMNILLLEYPIKSEGEKPAFSAVLMYSKESNEELIFIGLNTADYFDRQVFAVAHELYHFYTKTGSHLSRVAEEENLLAEAEANRFAAEFLLPESILEHIILNEFKDSSLKKVQIKTLLRFIARLQCTWWLPYRSLVRRLKEIDVISNQQYEQLYSINERNMDEEYGRMGRAINNEIFLKLNTATNNIGTSPKDIEVIIRNFEDNIIDEDKFINTLSLFNKNPHDYGYNIEVSDEDANEFEEFFNGEVRDER